MLFADATRSLKVKLAAPVTTSQLPLVGAWTEVTTAGLVQNASAFHLATSNASAVTIVSSPTAGNIRKLQGLMIVNQDTAQATVYVFATDGVDERDAVVVTLDVGDNLQFRDDGSWVVVNSGGQTKGIGSTGSAGERGESGFSVQGQSIRGEDGATWLFGSGRPDSSFGRHRDMYLDSATFNVWRKRQNLASFDMPAGWINLGSLKGAKGDKGDQGQSIRGIAGRDGQAGANGIAYSYPSGYRITTESGVSVSTSDRTSQGTIYLAKHLALFLLVPNASNDFDQFSPADSSLTWSVSGSSGDIKDLYVWNNAGTLTAVLSPAWSSSTTRGSGAGTAEQTTLKGIVVNAQTMGSMSALRGIYLGTICLSGSNVTEDSAGGTSSQVGGKRYVFNHYNQVRRHMAVIDTTDSWSYKTQTWRQMNSGAGANGNKVQWVSGSASATIDARITGGVTLVSNSTAAASQGIGVDSTSTPSGQFQTAFNGNAGALVGPLGANYLGQPGLGSHTLTPLEYGADGTTCNFLGDNGLTNCQTGLYATIYI